METELGRAVNEIRAGVVSESTLASIREIIAGNFGPGLISSLFAAERSAGNTEEDAISSSMWNLELLAEVSQLTACMLMVHLWPIASSLRDHGVADAIDLWIDDCNSEELTRHIELARRLEKDPAVSDHYALWLKQSRNGNAT